MLFLDICQLLIYVLMYYGRVIVYIYCKNNIKLKYKIKYFIYGYFK